MPSLSSLRAFRTYYDLTQDELAELLAISQAAVSRLECDPEGGPLETAFAIEILCGLPSRDVFRRLYQSVGEQLMIRAVEFDRAIRGKTDAKSLRLQDLLTEIVKRTGEITDAL